MNYETIQHLKEMVFKRLTGVQRETFEMMLKVVEKDLRDFGRPTKLSRADQLLMILMYRGQDRRSFLLHNPMVSVSQPSVVPSEK